MAYSHNLDIILTLAGSLSVALVLGLITERLRLSPIVGYLLAGVVIGAFTPGFAAQRGVASQLAEVGVVLLMFGVGLQFRVRELLAVRRVAVPGALVQISVATCIGALVACLWGCSATSGAVYGLAISVASTVVLLRVLAENRALHTVSGHIAVGWLVVQDVLTVLVLVLLPVLVRARFGSSIAQVSWAVVEALLKIAALVGFTFVVGRRAIPWLLTLVARMRSRELFTLAVLALALGISVGAAMLFGASMALGAFLAGMVVGQSEFSTRAASDALPMRDAFAVLFFVSMGMLFEPSMLDSQLGLTLSTLAVVLLANPLAALAVVLLLGKSVRTALVVAVALAQIGEFSFILAALGTSLGLLPESATQALVVVAIVSITLNPLLFRGIEPLTRWLSTIRPHLHEQPATRAPGGHHAVVVGYGPVGRMVTRLLRENGIAPTVVELNHDTVLALKADGIQAVYGDAARHEILLAAGVVGARSLIVSSGGAASDAVIRLAKQINPSILVLARATYARDAPDVARAGANVVVAAEAEVALAMTERLLVQLGATADQLDRERHRVRSDLAALCGVTRG